eukprot:scaffold19869_cov121-Isochrysis_galbana.AAC.4
MKTPDMCDRCALLSGAGYGIETVPAGLVLCVAPLIVSEWLSQPLGFTPRTNRNAQEQAINRHALLLPPQRHPPKRRTPLLNCLALYPHRLLPTQIQY